MFSLLSPDSSDRNIGKTRTKATRKAGIINPLE